MKPMECDHLEDTDPAKISRIKHINASMTADCEYFFRCCPTCRENVVANLFALYLRFINGDRDDEVTMADCPQDGGHIFPAHSSFAVTEENDIIRESEREMSIND